MCQKIVFNIYQNTSQWKLKLEHGQKLICQYSNKGHNSGNIKRNNNKV